jgi:hypothetical protein
MQGLLKSLNKRDITEVLKSSKRFGDHLISACLEDLNDRVGDHDGKLEDHDGRLEHVEDEVEDLNVRVGHHQERLTFLEDQKSWSKSRKYGEPMFLDRPRMVVGRTAQIEQVTLLLQDYKDVLLWGGPGEGKTTILRHVGIELYKQGRYPGGAFEVDLTGECCGLQISVN